VKEIKIHNAVLTVIISSNWLHLATEVIHSNCTKVLVAPLFSVKGSLKSSSWFCWFYLIDSL